MPNRVSVIAPEFPSLDKPGKCDYCACGIPFDDGSNMPVSLVKATEFRYLDVADMLNNPGWPIRNDDSDKVLTYVDWYENGYDCVTGIRSYAVYSACAGHEKAVAQSAYEAYYDI